MVVNYCFHAFDNCFHAFGAIIADFDVVPVKDLVEAVVLRKILIK